MENYKAIVEQARAIKIEDSFDRQRRFSREYEAATTTAEKIEVNKRHDAECRAEDERKIKRLVLIHNAEVAYVAEVLPKICAIYQRYAGKRVGEKTEKKINSEIKEAIGGWAFISNNGLSLYNPVTDRHFTLPFNLYDDASASYGKSKYNWWDAEGKLNKITPDMFYYGKRYIEDIDGYIEQKREQAAAYVELSKQLCAAYDAYTRELIEGFNRPDYGRTHTYLHII